MNNQPSILDQLNEVQRAAVSHTEGPVMVIAGAGSGKTRVLTYRVAHLLNLGNDPFNILALTFTNKAAREMKERIISLVGSSDARNVWMGTFHSIFARILRQEGHRLGYPQNFTIYDTDDAKSLLKTIIKEQNLDIKAYAPGLILHRISSAKNNLLSDRDYNDNQEVIESDHAAGRPFTGKLFSMYNLRLKTAQAMDFDDLLYNMNLLIRDFPEVLYKLQQKFKFILVDEYQDTNFAQYMIVKQLAAKNENICVVGDDAQSIYAFRGANIRNILDFQKDYPDAVSFKLEQNYRSTKTIVGAANKVIANNKSQIFKEIWTDNEEGERIAVLRAGSDNEEGQLIAQSVFETMMNHQEARSSFAILYRTNAQSRAIEEALRKLNIPYRIYGGLSFYRRKEIKDAIAYIRLAINPLDEESLYRVINYPARGIGDTTLSRIVVTARNESLPPWEIMKNISRHGAQFNAGTLRKIMDFVSMIESFSAQIMTRNAWEVAKHIVFTSGLMKELQSDESPEGVGRIENVEELLNAIRDFTESDSTYFADGTPVESSVKTLDMFMQEVALLTDADQKENSESDFVSLMTIHMAKGLEFPYVYVAGLEENLFPSFQSLSNRTDLEEERRLFYVAMTRAMKRLTLSYAENRYKYGEVLFCEPSRFLEEIPEDFLIIPGRKTQARVAPPTGADTPPPMLPKKLKKISGLHSNTQTSPQDPEADAATDIKAGMMVMHQRFGKGKVLYVEGSGPNMKTTVFFDQVGQKQLLLQYARLKIIG